MVTHDRMFLRRLATRIVELDRGRLTSWPGNYDDYVKLKAAELAAGENQQEAFDKKLAQEESWIRQGVKARRTRNEGRVRVLEQMRRKRRERRERPGTARMKVEHAGMSAKMVCEVTGATFGYGDRPVIKDFSTVIMRGDRIGIIGANGAPDGLRAHGAGEVIRSVNFLAQRIEVRVGGSELQPTARALHDASGAEREDMLHVAAYAVGTALAFVHPANSAPR